MADHHDDRTAAVRAAVDVFYERVLADPSLSPWFEGVDMARLHAHQRSFLVAALIGGDVYRGRGMSEAHRGLGIDDAAFDRTVEHLRISLRQVGLPESTNQRLCSQVEPLRRLVVES